jgi:hypothetical protein
MLATRYYRDAWEIDPRLIPFGATRADFWQVVAGVVGARADAVENDPATAEGQFAYIYGTRFLRSLLRTKGYLLYREDNIEGVRHPDRDLRIIYQSVDLAASWLHDPRPVSAKRSGSERIVDSAQGSLFTLEELSSAKAIKFEPINTGVWYFCVSVDGDDVRAELSLPSTIENGIFGKFIERIFIVGGGEWGDLMKKLGPDAAPPAEFEPIVTRK